MNKNKEIPEGFRIAGVRFRGKDVISKDECKEIIADMLDDLEYEGENIKSALKRADILEEEIRGKVRAFNLLVDPGAAMSIWKMVKGEDVCTPIIMTERRWCEELALREKKEEEEKIEEDLRKKRREERERKERERTAEGEFITKLKEIWNRLRKQVRKMKNQIPRNT